ncbi:hypothetical protein [Helicobacter sp. 23-1045]
METLKVRISPLVADDSREFASIFDMQKFGNLAHFNECVLNTRGTPNAPVKMAREMEFKLSAFDILHFENIEIVTTSGGAFKDGEMIQENAAGFGKHTFVRKNYSDFKRLARRFFIPLNFVEFKQSVKVLLSAIFGAESKRLQNNHPKILFHSPNWDCFSHFSFEEFPRLLATLKAFSKIGGGQHK